MDAPLAGRTAVITGGAEGLGQAIATSLASAGARVVICDIQTGKAEALAHALKGEARRLDVTNEADWDALGADNAIGAPMIVINNAGINPGPGRLEEFSFDAWQKTVAVNLSGVFLGCRYGARKMAAQGGSIVNISSSAASRVVASMPAYSASKAGVAALTRSVALYCGERGWPIRCNAISPGSVETPLVDRLREATGDATAARARSRAAHPIGFVGAPSDIAAAVLYLVSDAARFVTGANLAVDGGLTLGSAGFT